MEDNKKIKIQIKSVFGDVLFEYEKENNTIKDTVEEAAGRRIPLNGANLYGANLDGANLYGANLDGASLNRASLNRASLYRANLDGASLYRANLDGASLYRASLYRANLDGASLNRASLYRANLDGANLDGANLYRANLDGASLYGANLDGAKNIPYVPLVCPSDGAFVGWKKVINRFRYIVKLEIPEDAKRSSTTTRKCRCDKAKVLDIMNFDTKEHVEQVVNKAYDQETLYKVGKMVYPDKFDDDRWNECSNGIHFFINKQDAIDY